jgi:hypothetical protein
VEQPAEPAAGSTAAQARHTPRAAAIAGVLFAAIAFPLWVVLGFSLDLLWYGVRTEAQSPA